MQTLNIRRSIIRLAGIVAIMTGLVMSSGIAGAAHVEVGLTECNHDGCAVVTVDDLKNATRGTRVAGVSSIPFSSGPFDAQFTR